jgi:hypothetical protein
MADKRRNQLALAAIATLFGLAACFTDPGPPAAACEQGEMGCKCDEGSCGPDLQCLSDYCIPENCSPGETYCSCDAGGCGAGLVCTDGAVCLPPPADTGTGSMSSTTVDPVTTAFATDSASESASATASTSAADTTDTAVDPIVEPCDGCWSGHCELGKEVCALGVFVSSTQFLGDAVGDGEGPAAADAKCSTLAGSDGGAPKFAAWLGTDTVPAAIRAGLQADRIYVLPTGDVVATSPDDFVDGLLHAIDHTESGAPVPSGGDTCATFDWPVWTGTRADGSTAMANCNNWTSGANGLIGRSDATDSRWTDLCNVQCDTREAAIYCIEQPD